MKIGRFSSRTDNEKGLGQACARARKDGKMRRILTWPWNLKKAERGFDSLLDQCEGAGIGAPMRRRLSFNDLSVSSEEDSLSASDTLQGSWSKQKTSLRRGRLLTRSHSMWFTLALTVISLLGFFGAPSTFFESSFTVRSELRTADEVEQSASPSGVHYRGLHGLPSRGLVVHRNSPTKFVEDTSVEPASKHQGNPRLRTSKGDGYVEVMHAGWFVELPVALNLSLWKDSGVVYNDPRKPRGRYAREHMLKELAKGLNSLRDVDNDLNILQEEPIFHSQTPTVPPAIADLGFHLDMGRALARCPTSGIRVLIAVIARCCGSSAFSKRDAIRKTWMRTVNEQYSDFFDVRFFIAQPHSPEGFVEAYNALRGEIKMYNDITVLPGVEDYLELPRKTFEMVQYSVESPCDYTHVLKIDDDCYLRPDNLLEMIKAGHARPGRVPAIKEVPWMHGMYVGQVHGDETRPHQHGFHPDRNPKSKWYLTPDELPDELAPLGKKYHLGWGYMMSRDMMEHIAQHVAEFAANPERRPAWWALLPWEDTLVGVLLADAVQLQNHPGFKAAWNGCSNDTVVKHLDIDAPEFQFHLYDAESMGTWQNESVKCASGDFEPEDKFAWRAWRNSLPDVRWIGEE